MNSITIRNEGSGVERTLYIRQDVIQIAWALKKMNQSTTKAEIAVSDKKYAQKTTGVELTRFPVFGGVDK